MRSRSSRLFVVLLHLVGVSTHFPSQFPFSLQSLESGVGIVGVHPLSILLEPLELQAAGGLSELLKLLEDIGYDVDETVLKEPFWLQDDTDGSCLGPSGFSECGDATLWRIRRRKRPSPKKKGRRRRGKHTNADADQHKGAMHVQEAKVPSQEQNQLKLQQRLSASLQLDEKDRQGKEGSYQHQHQRKNILKHEEDEDTQWGYALQLADVVAIQSDSDLNSTSQDDSNNAQDSSDKEDEGECILSINTATQEDHNKNGMLEMGPCQSSEAWSWTINEGGVLQWQPPHHPQEKGRMHWAQILLAPVRRMIQNGASLHSPLLLDEIGHDWDGMHASSSKKEGKDLDDDDDDEANEDQKRAASCVWKMDDTSAITAPCHKTSLGGIGDHDGGQEQAAKANAPVNFSVIQYQNSAAKSPQLLRIPRHEEPTQPQQGAQDSRNGNIQKDRDARNALGPGSSSPTSTSSSLPHMKRTSQSKSTTNNGRVGASIKGGGENGMKIKSKGAVHVGGAGTGREILSPLGVGGYFEKVASQNEQILSPMGVGGYFEKISTSTSGKKGINILHHPPSSSPSSSPHHHVDAPHRPRKIPVHPYIAASVNGRYTDPVTGLTFPTDISEYLGHNRKEVGRHTLTGLGIYTKTMLKMKVYSVAFYVPKRDVLADPVFSDFATMDAAELSESRAFTNHLMTMSTSPQSGGHFDRTLFIKLNMQLSTETVRQSLTGDWSLLSQEHKDLLYNSSHKERQAGGRTLEIIQSEENTSNCSCGYIAPPEYEADESCCARGTEMVFTWRKNGDLELRIDQGMIDIYPYPEIGRGIFYEYLRTDDPISPEARDHFADGFPFLLAPLAQLKGFIPRSDASSSSSSSGESEKVKARLSDRNLQKVVGDVFENVRNRADGAMTWAQENIEGGISNVNHAMRTIQSTSQTIGSNIQDFGSELHDKRGQLWKQLMYNRDESMRVLVSNIPFLPKNLELQDSDRSREGSIDDDHLHVDSNDTEFNETKKKMFIFSPQIAKMFGDSSKQRPVSDEIGVIIEPTMSSTHMLFLYMVHFYLVLLLIVSVPDSSSTQVVRRSSASTLDSDSDHEERWLDLTQSLNENDHDHSELSSSTTGCSSSWNVVPGSIPKFVVERNGVEGNVDQLMVTQDSVDLITATSPERDNHEVAAAVVDERRRIMKKSLSYFL